MEVRERYINFYTDYAFKKLFGTAANKDLLIDFLNALFDGRECITDLTYLNTEQLGLAETERKAFFDVYCTNTRGEHFIVEMQRHAQKYFIDRTLYYTSFAVNQQGEKGEWDYCLKKVYVVSILNFVFDHSAPEEYRHDVMLTDTRTKEVFYDKWLEMPKFTKKEDELETQFEKWMYAIAHLCQLEGRPAALSGAIFTRLFEQAEVLKFTPEERMDYILSRKQLWDEYSVRKYQWEQGLEQGRKAGLKEGEAIGRKAGLEEGQEIGRKEGGREKALAIALHLKQMGLSDTQVMQATGLSAAELETVLSDSGS